MRFGFFGLGAMLVHSFGLGAALSMPPEYHDVPVSLMSAPGSDGHHRGHSSGTRARRQWKRRRAAGITKRVRA